MLKEIDFEDIFFDALLGNIDNAIIEHSEAIKDLVFERSVMLATRYDTDMNTIYNCTNQKWEPTDSVKRRKATERGGCYTI